MQTDFLQSAEHHARFRRTPCDRDLSPHDPPDTSPAKPPGRPRGRRLCRNPGSLTSGARREVRRRGRGRGKPGAALPPGRFWKTLLHPEPDIVTFVSDGVSSCGGSEGTEAACGQQEGLPMVSCSPRTPTCRGCVSRLLCPRLVGALTRGGRRVGLCHGAGSSRTQTLPGPAPSALVS